MAAHYDDPSFFYDKYWQGRTYEDASERIAIRRFLKNRRFHSALDIGGGFGRLTSLLADFTDRVTLVEPSVKQRSLAAVYLKNYKKTSVAPGTIEKIPFPENSQELIIIVRVFHHLPDPAPALSEVYRILKPGGLLILEYANSFHFKARLQSFVSGHPILLTPVERRSSANIRRRTIPFVNHHPYSINKLLTNSKFSVLETYSVSNFRSPLLKKIIPLKLLVQLEKYTQKLLAPIYFGPSIFVLAQKC